MKILKEVHLSSHLLWHIYVKNNFHQVSPQLKFSEINPLHKKETTDVTNFRPICLLTSFLKILEKVVYAILYQHINQDNTCILTTQQHGFRNNSSTEKSLKLINETFLVLNNTLTVGGIFCDLENIWLHNHDILLSKCEFCGFRVKTNALLWSYLSEKYQRVLINNISSNNTTFSELGQNKTWRSSRFNTWSFVLLNLYRVFHDFRA